MNRLGLNSILVRVFLGNRTNRSTDVDRKTEKEIYYKILAQSIVDAW